MIQEKEETQLMASLLLWTTEIWFHQRAFKRVCGTHLRIISERQRSQSIYLQIPVFIHLPIQSMVCLDCLEHSQAGFRSQRDAGSHLFANYLQVSHRQAEGTQVGGTASTKVLLITTLCCGGKRHKDDPG